MVTNDRCKHEVLVRHEKGAGDVWRCGARGCAALLTVVGVPPELQLPDAAQTPHGAAAQEAHLAALGAGRRRYTTRSQDGCLRAFVAGHRDGFAAGWQAATRARRGAPGAPTAPVLEADVVGPFRPDRALRS